MSTGVEVCLCEVVGRKPIKEGLDNFLLIAWNSKMVRETTTAEDDLLASSLGSKYAIAWVDLCCTHRSDIYIDYGSINATPPQKISVQGHVPGKVGLKSFPLAVCVPTKCNNEEKHMHERRSIYIPSGLRHKSPCPIDDRKH